MRVVIALGGNAIAKRGEPLEADLQRSRVREAVAAIADIARGNEVVVTHGNGPQVGLLAVQSQALPGLHPYPLDVLGAESEGMIGYMLELEFASTFPNSEVATLLTQVEVDADDPALGKSTKPIGPLYPRETAEDLASRFGWEMAAVHGGYRRIVPSPEPQRIREQRTIEILMQAGVLVVCAGGGGVPVVVRPDAGLQGVEAVIDKDLTASLLATQLHADALLLLTDVSAVFEDWPEPRRRALRSASIDELRRLSLEPGSMAPKVEAACRFVEKTGGTAAIGSLGSARRVFQGLAGTRIRAGNEAREYWPTGPDRPSTADRPSGSGRPSGSDRPSGSGRPSGPGRARK